jgi:copper chaperone CopZ
METHSLNLQGMSCAACAGAIEKRFAMFRA